MPHSAAIHLWPPVLALAVLICAGTAQAQYAGGQGDGYSSTGVGNVYIDGSQVFSAAYFASTAGGDGYATAGQGNVSLNGSTLPAALFTSSTAGGDGYAVIGAGNQLLNGTAVPAAVYTSSTTGGDGYDFSGLANWSLDGAAALLEMYAGGTAGGDGYDVNGLSDLPLDVNLAYHFIFSGGSGDGYDTRGVILTTVDGSTADPAPYTSSVFGGDGYDTRGLQNNRLDGFNEPVEIYTSSVSGGDGYDTSGISFVDLTGASAALVSYLGGGGDGYDDEGLRNLLLDASLALPSFVYTGGGGDGYDTETVPYVLFLGNGGAAVPMTYSIWRDAYFSSAEIAEGLAADGVDADGDGLGNLIEYTTGGDPRTADSGVFGPQFRLSDLSDFGRTPLPDKHLTVIVRRDPRIFDATLAVEFSSDTFSLWNTGEAVVVNSTPSVSIVRDSVGVQDAPRRLLRLRATLNP
jgi:hypothetical protein